LAPFFHVLKGIALDEKNRDIENPLFPLPGGARHKDFIPKTE